MKKELKSAPLTQHQVSIAQIAGLLYDYFRKGEYGIVTPEFVLRDEEETIRCCHLSVFGSVGKRMYLIHSKKKDGAATAEKFSISSRLPSKGATYSDRYEFDIIGEPSSGSWAHGEGNQFVERLSMRFNTSYPDNSLSIESDTARLVAIAIEKARKLSLNSNVVRQKFIDRAEKPPR